MLSRKSNLVEKSAGKKQGSILDYRNTQNAIWCILCFYLEFFAW